MMMWPYSSVKHPSCVNQICIPWSTIFRTDTKLLVIVGTCKTFISLPFCLTWLSGILLTCFMGCEVSSPISTTPGCSSFSKYENHSLWLIIWFHAPELTYHTSFGLELVVFIELALCFITKVGPFPIPAPSKPST